MSKSPWTPLQIIVLLCFIHQRDSWIVMILYGVHVLPTWWDIIFYCVIVHIKYIHTYIYIIFAYTCICIWYYMLLYIYIYRVRKYLYILYIYIYTHSIIALSGPILREEVGRPSGRGFFRGMNQETCHDWESWRGLQTWATLDLGCWSLGHSNSKASLPGGNHLRKQLGLTWVDITFCVYFSVVFT
jgi:hypothetical protein